MMSKLRSLTIAVLLVPLAMQAATKHTDDSTSKTFFSVNPQYSTGRPEHISFYRTDRMMAREDGWDASFQVVGFGGQSTNHEGLARYFFPWQKNCLTIAEGPNPDANGSGAYVGGADAFNTDSYDLLARNFNIETANHNFQSRIKIRPEQSYGGGAFNYRQALTRDRTDKGFWFDITIPVMQVKNSMHLSEVVTTSGTPLEGTSANMRAAFMNPAWNYGKIAPCALKKVGVADVEIRIGRDSVRDGQCRYGGFVGVIIPGGNRPCGKYVFEPMIGRNHHYGLIWGSASTFCLWENQEETSRIRLNIEMNNNYLFESTERRSFDLRDKSWSRYINLFADSTATTTIPGINVLTQKLKIHPRGTYQINSGFTFDWGEHFQFEVGSQLYARQAEKGRLACPWQEGPGIAGTTTGHTESNATMHSWDYQLILDDVDLASLNTDTADDIFIFKPITECDLDLQSALHPATIGHTFYGTLGYQNLDTEYPWFAAVGGGYQWCVDNTVMQRWSVWGKLELSV